MRYLKILVLTFASACSGQVAGEADARLAARLFRAHCAPCHGPRGDGGKGANLAQPKLLRAPDDNTLREIILNGIPGTEMPPSRMTDREAWAMVAYVRSLGRIQAEPVQGNVRRGEALFWNLGKCGQCHTVGVRGGRMGPDLSDIGARRSPGYLRASIVDPGGGVPDNFTTYRRVVFIPDNFLLVRVVTSQGDTLTGVRLNEDTFTIQIRDFSDRLLTFEKSSLRELDKQWGKSSMPGYREVFTPAELEDVVAYLVSLRGHL